MRNYIKFLPIVIALCALADTQFEMLKGIGLSEVLINWIKFLGLVLSVFLPSIQELFNDEVRLKNTDPVPTTTPNKKPPKRP
jgi:hypothetical protein